MAKSWRRLKPWEKTKDESRGEENEHGLENKRGEMERNVNSVTLPLEGWSAGIGREKI